MKKLLILLFSFFLLGSPSVFADNISDFSIEGISIGDSLLDYMTEEEILKEIELNKDHYYYLNEPNKYAEVYLFKDFPIYEAISVFIKNTSPNQYVTNKNEKYKILSIYGMMDYIENFDGCIVKRDEIAAVLSKTFPNAYKREKIFEHSVDPVSVDAVYFEFESGDKFEVTCDNFEETFRIKNNYTEGLNVAIKSKEITSWLRDY